MERLARSQSLDIELLKRDVKSLTELCSKMDVTIDNLQEISSKLSNLLSLLEQRIEVQEKIVDNVELGIDQFKKDVSVEHKDIRDQIQVTRNDMMEGRVQFLEKLNETEKNVISELDKKIVDASVYAKNERMGITERLSKIETWKWMVVGGGVLISWVATRIIDWSKLIAFILSHFT